MQKPASLQRARARARARSKSAEPQSVETLELANDTVAEDAASPSNDNVVPLPAREAAPYADEIDEETLFIGAEAEEPPFDPPALDELLGPGDADPAELEAANDAAEEPPLVEELAPVELAAPDAPVLELDEEIPFDPPDEEDEIFQSFDVAEPEPEPAPERPKHPLASPRASEPKTPDVPLPPIRLHVSWDSPETAALYHAIAGDKRCAAAELSWSKGGLDGTIAHCREAESPDLIVIESKLSADELLAGVDRLHAVTDPGVKILILGAVNDVSLLRGLAQRGVAEYVVTPAAPDALVSSFCRLFETTDKSHTIAIVGARGGVGASTIAHNIAWSIAERQGAPTALLDLDLAFGTAALDFNQTPEKSLSDALLAESLDGVIAEATPRLRLLSAPLVVERALELEPENVAALIARVRRQNAYVVLDLPHTWTPWVKQTLLAADSALIVASPDLASLRNTDNMLKLLRSEAARQAAPLIALSMSGVPKRPEISIKEFSDAIAATPVAAFPFDPALYAGAAIKNQMLGEAAPTTKAARAIDELASEITGRPPSEKKRAPQPLPEMPRAELLLDAPVTEQKSETAVSAESAPVAPQEELLSDEAFAPRPFGKAAASTPKVQAEELPPLAPLAQRVMAVPTPVTHDRFAEARRAAEAEMAGLQRHKPRKRSSGFLRVAASVAVLAAAIGYYAQQRSAPANASEPRVAAASSVASAATLSLPNAVVDPNVDRAEFQSAVRALGGADAAEAVQRLQRLADRGIAPAQYRLAKLYERGEHVEADLGEARQWTERAAAAGHVLAMHDLGVYYARAEGGGGNDAAAFRWFRQAAEYGVADSQYNLGVFYQQGRGVTESDVEALFWFMLAAAQGDETATAKATALSALLTPMQVEQARARAQSFRARTPHPDANLEG
jgi:pilus assembly protein CpaE